MKRDANDILREDGPDALRAVFQTPQRHTRIGLVWLPIRKENPTRATTRGADFVANKEKGSRNMREDRPGSADRQVTPVKNLNGSPEHVVEIHPLILSALTLPGLRVKTPP